MPAFLAWPVLKAFFGGWLSKLWKWLSSLSFWQLACMGLAIFSLVQHFEIVRARGEAVKWQKQYAAEKTAFDKTVAAYRAAAAQAEAADKANTARVKAQQDQISKEQSDEYQTRLAAARAEYQRLLDASKAAANPSGSTGASVPSLSAPIDGPSQTTGQDGLSDALTATEQSIQLDELIKWVRAEHAVNPNK